MNLSGVLDRCVLRTDGCIEWKGAHDGKGYPHYGFQNRTLRVVRSLYEQFCSAVPDGHELHHSCGRKWCVNPFHVTPTTRREHMVQDGRMFHRDKNGRMLGLPSGGA